MAVTLNAIGTQNHNADPGGTSFDFVFPSFTAGTNTVMLLAVAYDVSTSSAFSCIWDPLSANQPFSLITSTTLNGTNGLNQLWGLVNPTSADSHATLTWTGGAEVGGCLIAFDGVKQTFATAFSAATPTTGSSTSPSINVPSAVGNYTLGLCYNVGDVFSAFTQTMFFDDAPFAVGGAHGTRAAGAASVTHGWTTSNNGWIVIGTDIVAEGGGGPTGGLMWL